MFENLLIALRLKKKPIPPRPPMPVYRVPRPEIARNAYIPPRPSPATTRSYTAAPVAPSPAPDSSNLVDAALIYAVMNSGSPSPAPVAECRRDPEPYTSGGGGDYGGGGASSSWESSSDSSSSYSSSDSSSSDSSSSSSSSSD